VDIEDKHRICGSERRIRPARREDDCGVQLLPEKTFAMQNAANKAFAALTLAASLFLRDRPHLLS
jgi:hypothetical protein